MDAHLGYAKYHPAGRDDGNSRNGHRAKAVLTDAGPAVIAMLWDQHISFASMIATEPQRRPGEWRIW